ncbi:MAG: aspartate aminotransferase family protein [Bernardetiaceae bacterium]
MKTYNVYPVYPIEVVSGKGAYVYDNHGTEYLDFYGGHAVISIGHGHPRYVQAICEQVARLGFYSNAVELPLQRQLAQRLGEVSHKNDYQLFLCSSGAEANENALKLASFYNQRSKVITFEKGFHGRTSLALAATDNPKILAPVNATKHIIRLPLNDIAALTQTFEREGPHISSVIVEGIQGVGGIRVAEPDFLKAIRDLTRQHDAVMIADEVQAGYGRTGRFFSQEEADIFTMAKGMGNGFPIGGIIVAPHFEPWYGQLGTTFGGNPLACAAGLAVLDTLVEENLLQNAQRQGKVLIEELTHLPHVRQVRGRGLMIGIELPEDLPHIRKDLLMKGHVFTGTAAPNIIRLLPPLTIGEAELDRFLSAFKATLQAQ